MKPADRHVMLFDMYVTGHHAQHLLVLADYWSQNKLPGQLSIVVPPDIGDAFPGFEAQIASYRNSGVSLHFIDQEFLLPSQGPFQLIKNDLRHGRVLHHYTDRLHPDHCLLMYFDHVQLSLSRGLRFDYPVQLSGIYFRPSFHYPTQFGWRPSLSERIRNIRKRTILQAALRNPHFKNLFSLDPYAVKSVRELGCSVNVSFLPEPFEIPASHADPNETRRKLGVEPGRFLFLLFGALRNDKGVLQALEAFRHVPDHLCRRACLLLAGRVPESDAENIQHTAQSIENNKPVQILVPNSFVADDQIQNVMAAADVALLPYQRHVGSSGVLIRAARAGTPVLGSNYGLLGAHIRNHRLGLSLDTTNPRRLADGLIQCLEDPATIPFDPATADDFAVNNTNKHYAQTIFGQLCNLDTSVAS